MRAPQMFYEGQRNRTTWRIGGQVFMARELGGKSACEELDWVIDHLAAYF